MLTGILLTLLWATQGIPILPGTGGTVSGTMRGADGKPAARVRVAAMTRPEGGKPTDAGTSLVSLAETDDSGRYRLEDIPPGQYYIVAGRVALPTFYPGTQEMSAGTVLQVLAGSNLTGIDFALQNSNQAAAASVMMTVSVPIRVQSENGAKFPISSKTGPVKLRFEPTKGGTVISEPITSTSARLLLPVSSASLTEEFRVGLENLPAGYNVKSIVHGTVEITSGLLRIRPPSATVVILSTGAGTTNTTNSVFVTTGFTLTAMELITVTIQPPQSGITSGNGVRVTGVGRIGDTHPVVLSGTQGIVFNDGSFEFRDVTPGRHRIALIDSPGRSRGATIIVGQRDVENVTLDDVSALPVDIQTLTAEPAGGIEPGTKLSLTSIRGRVLDEATGGPPPSAQIFISGKRGPSYTLNEEGRFEIPNLLPGSYRLQIQVAGRPDVERDVQLGIETLSLDVSLRKLD